MRACLSVGVFIFIIESKKLQDNHLDDYIIKCLNIENSNMINENNLVFVDILFRRLL